MDGVVLEVGEAFTGVVGGGQPPCVPGCVVLGRSWTGLARDP